MIEFFLNALENLFDGYDSLPDASWPQPILPEKVDEIEDQEGQ